MPENDHTVRLRHLTLRPTGGIGNRLRAIASAHRLCRATGARCSIVWEWGAFEDFFVSEPDLEIIDATSPSAGQAVYHQMVSRDPSPLRTVDVTCEQVDLVSGTVFWGSHQPPIHDQAVLRDFIPRLHPRLQQAVDDFTQQHRLDQVVGFHMRRTDQVISTRYSPDRLFIAAGRRIVANRGRIFLTTDNSATAGLMQRHFGAAVLVYPKRTALDQRWPRSFDREATEDDLIELFLLGKTAYVAGSYWSSFTDLALVLNGSTRCTVLQRDWAVRLRDWGRRLRWWRKRLFG